MRTDIEIAQSCDMRPIYEVAKKAGIPESWVEPYGKYRPRSSVPRGRPRARPGS